MTENLKWVFEKFYEGTSTKRGFKNNNIERFSVDLLKSIVREAIQNSTDVRDKDNNKEQVVMEFKRGSIKKDYLPHFSAIEDHIRSCLNYDDVNDDAAKSLIQKHIDIFSNTKGYSYIQISDYNTTGMTTKELEALTQSDEVSHKQSNTAQGSKGVGKAAYFAGSYLRTILVSTVSDEGFRFRGTSKISTHEDPFNPGKYLKEQGYYNNINILSPAEVPELFRRTKKGSSVFIMGSMDYDEFNDENFKSEIIKEVLRNYWFGYAN